MKLTLFYDSHCPLCVAEMRQLKSYNTASHLIFVDIHRDDFSQLYPEICQQQADRVLHARKEDGSMLLGLDATCEAWLLVGKHRWLGMLRWPVIKPIADFGYRVFARHRYRISYWLTGQKRCDTCRLDI